MYYLIKNKFAKVNAVNCDICRVMAKTVVVIELIVREMRYISRVHTLLVSISCSREAVDTTSVLYTFNCNVV